MTHLGLFFQAKTQREITVIHYTHPPGASNGSRSWVGSQNTSTLLEESMSRARLGVIGSQYYTENEQQGKTQLNGFLHKGNTSLIFPPKDAQEFTKLKLRTDRGRKGEEKGKT